MDPQIVAAVGGLGIGLIAGVVGTSRTVRVARPGPERRAALRWSAVFTLAIAAFAAGVCLAPSHACWLFGVPLLTVAVIAVHALNDDQTNVFAEHVSHES
ncbi:MAG: hypothetical protein QM811_23055 [Pirellulales bacterium]